MNSPEPLKSTPAATERHGPLARAALFVVGLLFAVLGGLLVVVGVELLRRGPVLAGVFVTALFAAIGLYGLELVSRGLRGSSSVRFAKASAWYQRHGYALGVLGCGVITAGWIAQSGGLRAYLEGSPRLSWWVFLALALLPLHVLLHELGHALAARLVGLEFRSLSIGRIVIRSDRGRLRVGLSPVTLGGVLGFHASLPDLSDQRRLRSVVHLAAGPLTSALVALACWRASGAPTPNASLVTAVVADALRVGLWTSGFLALVNALPLRTGGVATDGLKILTQLTASDGTKALLRIGALGAHGIRPRDWQLSVGSLLDLASAARTEQPALRLCALLLALDTGDDERVRQTFASAANGPALPPLVQHELELQRVMYDALHGDVAAARARFAGLGPHPTVPDYPRLAEATVLAAEGKFAESRAALDTWEDAIARTGLGASIRTGNEWAVDALRERLALAASA